jgi:hypothetical protein
MKPHEYTNADGKVLLVKCLNQTRGNKYNSFIWPKSGKVPIPKNSRLNDCQSGGFFGWPWGIGIGCDHPAIPSQPWIVISVDPKNIIGNVENKAKSKACCDDDMAEVEIVYDGDMAGAMYFTSQGRIQWMIASAKINQASASSGDYSTGIGASSGYSSTGSGASSGDSSTGSGASSGDYSTGSGASSGYSSTGSGITSGINTKANASATGKNSIAVAVGDLCRVRIGENGLAIATYRDSMGDMQCISSRELKPNVWYVVNNGKFCEEQS